MSDIKRLLVVDDDIDFADSLADLLDTEGFEVETAYSGKAAIGMMRNEPFDLALIDVQMPGKNGVDSLVEIRRLRPSARVVIMTGYSVPALIDRAVVAGAWGVIHKPLDLSRLLDMIVDGEPSPVVLVADDDAEFVDSLQTVLEGAGYAVMAAADGPEVLERAAQRRPDLLLLDLRMPGMSGIEVHAALRARGTHIPTVIVSAYCEEERGVLAAFPDLSADRIVHKPVDAEGLLQLVGSICAPQ